jgi:hypothetical protein
MMFGILVFDVIDSKNDWSEGGWMERGTLERVTGGLEASDSCTATVKESLQTSAFVVG